MRRSLVEAILQRRLEEKYGGKKLKVEDFIRYSENGSRAHESENRAEVCRRAHAKWKAKVEGQKRMREQRQEAA